MLTRSKPGYRATEYQECIAFAEWLELDRIDFIHVLNEVSTTQGGRQSLKWRLSKQARIGVKRGALTTMDLSHCVISFMPAWQQTGSYPSKKHGQFTDRLEKGLAVEEAGMDRLITNRTDWPVCWAQTEMDIPSGLRYEAAKLREGKLSHPGIDEAAKRSL